MTTPAASIGQTVSGLTPNYPYTVSAYISGGAATLTAGATNTTATGGSGWTEIHVTAASSSSGTLAITALASGSTNVYWDDFSMNASGVAGGQQFGYDGFGNLLSQTPIVGSAPMMSLTVNPNTNQVTSGGATYDGAGNLTYDGTRNYTFDELNRMASAGTVNYSYSPGENKRMVVSGTINGQPTQLLDFFLYSPNGKLMSVFGYQKSGSSWQATAGNQTNLFYLGSKALSFAENNVGSSTSSTYWPYGSINTGGSGPGGFASYWGDWSGLYYADQRYYNQNWGRFLTADPANNHRRGLRRSGAWNKYSYTLGDPINRNDRHGKCSDMVAGSTQQPLTYNQLGDVVPTDVYALAGQLGAVSAFPYNNIDLANSVMLVDDQSLTGFYGVGNTQSGVTAMSLEYAIAQSPTGTITLYCFSAGAQACNTAFNSSNINPASIDYVFYLSPGVGPLTGSLPVLGGTLGTFVVSNPGSAKDAAAGSFAGNLVASQGPPTQYYTNSCDHDFTCSMKNPATSLDGSSSITPNDPSFTGGVCGDGDYFSTDGGVPDDRPASDVDYEDDTE